MLLSRHEPVALQPLEHEEPLAARGTKALSIRERLLVLQGLERDGLVTAQEHAALRSKILAQLVSE